MVLAPEQAPVGAGASTPPTPWIRRHRTALAVCVALAMTLAGGAAIFAYQWSHAGPGELSGSAALHRFQQSGPSAAGDPGALQPRQGVYSYTGHADEHVSVPPKSQTEGPRFPGTVSYLPDGCWVFRLDYSDSHWQSTTYCPRQGNLVQAARAGWYRWDFVALTIADTASFTCQEMAVPAVLVKGQRLAFACTGGNKPLDTGTVTMTGTTEFLGSETLQVGGRPVPCLHFRELARFGGGQTGTNTSDIWMSAADGLPVRGSWATEVSTPSPLGTSVMTGSADFRLSSLTPRS